MSTIFIILLFICCGIVIFLARNYDRQSRKFEKKMKKLHLKIGKSKRRNTLQSEKLKLSEDFDRKFENARQVLNEDIGGLQYQMFETLSRNGLL